MYPSKYVFAFFISFFLLSAFIAWEPYKINAGAATKKVLDNHYKMGTSTNPNGESITLNNYYLVKGNKPWLPVMGEMHYARYQDLLWDDAIKKMKAGGVDIVSTYSFWIHHEEIEGQFDFTGRRDVKRFVEICKANNMYVVLRLGPFCNGEVRNGGIPDWIKQKGVKARSNDPAYLNMVRTLYQQYFNQVKGLLYKDGGPVIGIQLDNELNNPDHILELKKIAREIGFDVPLYTVTGWNNVVIPEKEVIPVQAGYPDDFWTRGVGKNPPNPQFLFMTGIPINTGVGTDVLPVLETYGKRTYNPSDYPWLLAELGLGMQWTKGRRPVIDERDAGALMLVKLAGGANCLGYYMYLGGSNPEGKLTTLSSGRGMPLISYDYQAAISEFGELPRKYHVLKLVHYFIQDFGLSLAPMIPAMPSKQPSGVEDVTTFRCMTRTNKNAGYFFFSNYQRYVENKNLDNIQVQVTLEDSTVTIPSKPVSIPKNAFGIWPINLNMNDVVLEYATAQLFARFPGTNEDVYFFFAHDGIAPEFSFKSNTISGIDAGRNQLNRSTGKTMVLVKNPGIANKFVIKSTSGKQIRICVLPYQLALRSTRIEFQGKQRLVITDSANTIAADHGIDILSSGASKGAIWMYPAPGSLRAANAALKGKDDGIFRKFEWSVKRKVIAVQLKQLSGGDNGKYEVLIPSDVLNGIYDVQLDIAHACDYMTARLDDRIIGDWYYIGTHYRPSLLHWGKQVLGKTVSFELTPLTAKTEAFIEKEFLPDFSVKQSYAEISSMKAIPVYRISLK